MLFCQLRNALIVSVPLLCGCNITNEDGEFAQFVETPDSVDQAKLDGYDGRFLLKMALKHDEMDVVQHIVLSPFVSEGDNWPAAEIEWLKSEKEICEKAGSSKALKFLIDSGFDCSSYLVVSKAFKNNDIESVKLIYDRYSSNYQISWLCAHAAGTGNLEMQQFFKPKCPTMSDSPSREKICKRASKEGNLKVLEWVRAELENCGSEVYDVAMQNDQVDVFVWAQSAGIPLGKSTEWASFAALYGQLEFLKWGESNGAQFDGEICSNAAPGGHLNILQWAKQSGLPCTNPDIIFQAITKGHIEVVDWAIENEVQIAISSDSCKSAMSQGSLDALKWYNGHHLKCEAGQLVWAFIEGHTDVLEWARSIGLDFMPSSEDFVKVAETGKVDSLKWAHAHRYFIAQNDIREIASRGCFDSLKWALATYEIADAGSILSSIVTAARCPTKQETDDLAVIQLVVGKGAVITENMITDAVSKRTRAALAWMLENGPAANEEATIGLARRIAYRLLKLAAAHGAKLSKNVCEVAMAGKHFSILNWLIVETNDMECFASAKRHGGIVETWAKFKSREFERP